MLWDNEDLGKYVVALTFASTGLAVVSGAFYKVLFPHLANMRGAALQGQLLKRGIVVAGALLLALSFPLAVAIPWLVPRLFGAAFGDAAGLAQVLLLAYLFVALKTVVIQGLRGVGESTLGSFAAALGLLLFLLLALPFGNAWGLYGVATALGLADACALGYLLFHLKKRGLF
jgi:O-antigen/teichoic acid export membrane protein